MRYNADGTPDAAFGSGGKLDIVTGGASADQMTALAVQADGKIVVVGHSSLPPTPDDNFIVMRFNADGTPDASFGTGGKVITDFEHHFDDASAVMLDGSGRILVAGHAQIEKLINVGGIPIQIVDQDFAVVRYLPDGTLDPAYGSGGKTTLDVGGLDYLNAARMQPDGSIVAVGRSTVSNGTGNPDMAVARFLSDGHADPAFGTGGSEHIDFASGVVPVTFAGGLTDEALDVAVEGDGKILVAGYMVGLGNPPPVGALFRLQSNGALQQNLSPAIAPTLTRVNAVAVQGDGRFVIAGAGNSDFGLERFNTDGTPDTAFGQSGLMTVDFFGGTDQAFDVLVDSADRIVAGGSARSGSTGGTGLVRILP